MTPGPVTMTISSNEGDVNKDDTTDLEYEIKRLSDGIILAYKCKKAVDIKSALKKLLGG